MQELLLFGQVPLARHDYVLSVLAGIAAMQPKPILEKHLVFKPSRPLAANVRASSSIAVRQQVGVSTSSQLQRFQAPPGDLFYLKVVIDINDLTRSGAANIAVERNGWASSNKDGVSWFFASPCLLLFYKSGCKIIKFKQKPFKIPNTDLIASTTCKSRKIPEEWTLQFRDLPEVNGRRTVTSRQMFDIDFKSGEALAFMSALDYSWVIYPPPLPLSQHFL